ncbi:hypothetical protein QBC46DRAFT_127459 [Diplogelasinospora grovesii]|uniref:Extracellular membrane protein CFEM domain-containing protein n=1 Tax=Diplogelasinospora grovesii TaxID=303347 RepID=A0AAN6N6V7_9PEZI|nr:hypothetical protein QBC46DRAFT_127459 [Diplogelasinospora grovesii]
MRHRRTLLPSALVGLVLVSLTRAASSPIDFSFYPSNAQDCMYRASNASSCAADTVEATNNCLCSNGGDFVTNTAACLGQDDPGDLQKVYDSMSSACENSNTPLTVAQNQYMSAASVTSTNSATSTKSASKTSEPATTPTTLVTSTTGSASPSATGVPQRDQNNPDGQGGLSSGARVGIIAGSVIAGLAMLGSLVWFFLRYKRKKDEEESHPMLAQQKFAFGAPGSDYSSAVPTTPEINALAMDTGGNGDHSEAWPQDNKYRPVSGQTQGTRISGFNWETPDDLGWDHPPVPAADEPKLSVMQRQGPPVFELQGSTQLPAEVPGMPLHELSGSAAAPTHLPPGVGQQQYSGAGWGPAPPARQP